ncbi:hypothetical protein BgiMline_034750 [Biomphalaria glabrata]|nr:CAunnamed protein product [Biomphalaria glabrata]KAI8776485.1 CAunnamed protein product [Biomphalaria glabrata]
MEYIVSADPPHNNTEHLRMMINAVDAVISGKMSQRVAAKAYNIPRSTLRSHLPKHSSYKHRIPKPPAGFKGKTILSKKEEKELVEFIINMYRSGFGRTRQDVLFKVQDMLNKAERKTKFENNLPNDEWFESFLERHKSSIKECIIASGFQEKGVVPLDVYSVEQTIQVAVPQPALHQHAHNNPILYHHPVTQPQHQQPQQLSMQQQLHCPQLSSDNASRCRLLPYSFQM